MSSVLLFLSSLSIYLSLYVCIYTYIYIETEAQGKGVNCPAIQVLSMKSAL